MESRLQASIDMEPEHRCRCGGAGWDGCEPTAARVPSGGPDRKSEAMLTATAALLMLEWPEPIIQTAALTSASFDNPSITSTTQTTEKHEEASHGYL